MTRGRAPAFGAARAMGETGLTPGRPPGARTVPTRQPVTPEDVRHRQMVPPAGATHLDDVHLELAVVHAHPVQLRHRFRLAAGRAQLVAVDVVHVRQPLLAADRARRLGRLAVVARGPLRGRDGRRRRPAWSARPRTDRRGRRAAGARSPPPVAGSAPGQRTRWARVGAAAARVNAEPGAALRPARSRPIVAMYRRDTSRRDDERGRGEAGRCSSSPCSACSARPPCTATSCAQRLKAVLGAFRAFSYGSLYPTLRRMRERGWITEEAPDPDGDRAGADRPPRQGRLPAHRGGQGAARRAARRGRPDGVRRRGLRGALRLLRADRRRGPAAHPGGPPPPGRGAPGRPAGRLARTRAKLDRYTLELQEHGLDAVEREVRWLNELIDTERREQHGRNPPQRYQKETP